MTLVVPDLEHFAAFCGRLTLDSGEPMTLEPFQKTILGDYFAGVTESLVLIPKKNGKTTLIAAVALHHLLYVPDAEVIIVASSVKQATLLYNFAKRFVNRSPALQKRLLVRAGTREIRSRRDDGVLQVLASDKDTADGVGPSLAIVDELHRQKSGELYGVLSDGLDARDGRMITISTAGADEDSPLGRMRANAIEHGRVTKRGRYRCARSREGGFVMHEWALAPTDDLDDLRLVKQVNPLATMTVAKLRRRQKSPSMNRGRWARFACNVWAQSDDAAISALDWGPCHEDYRPLVPGTRDVVIAIDLGWKRDTTVVSPVGVLDDEDRFVNAATFYDEDDDEAPTEDEAPDVPVATFGVPTIIAPPGDGTMTPDDVVKDAIRDVHEVYPDAVFAIDPNADGQHIAQWIETELVGGDDERVIEHSQQPSPMCDASMGLAAQVRAKAIRQPDDPGLNAHMLAAVAKWHGERWRFVQPHAAQRDGKRKPIDAAVTSAMGLRVLRAPKAAELEPFVIVV